MKNPLALVLLVSSMWLGCSAQNNVCLPVEDNPFSNEPAFAQFTQSVHVLDCFYVLAEPVISEAQLLHVASVVADLLDQDEDGVADDPQLQSVLANGGALMPVLAYEGSPAEEDLWNEYEGDGISAVLYADEIDPSQPGHWGADATVEEVLHALHHVGHVEMYPAAFGLDPSSSLLSEAMDVARSGQFLTVPEAYPEAAWYHYDDQTCDYGCMAIEYLYWATVTEMGILNDSETADGIADEWALYSPALLESTDVLVHALIADPQYQLPLQAPDGQYCPAQLDVRFEGHLDRVLIEVLDLSGKEVPMVVFEGAPMRLFICRYSDGTSRQEMGGPRH
jgi:hypothetical protein